MIWYSHLSKNFPQFVVIHTVKGLIIINEAEVEAEDIKKRWQEYTENYRKKDLIKKR